MGELGALFNPGMRHELEERRARAARREEEGNARDGDLRIDLDSGVAVINAPDDEDEDEERTGDAQERATEARSDAGPDDADPDGAGPVSVEGAEPADRPVEDALAVVDGSASAEPDDAPVAPVRPRGKRAMSASKR